MSPLFEWLAFGAYKAAKLKYSIKKLAETTVTFRDRENRLKV
jgi:hypothetical protein